MKIESLFLPAYRSERSNTIEEDYGAESVLNGYVLYRIYSIKQAAVEFLCALNDNANLKVLIRRLIQEAPELYVDIVERAIAQNGNHFNWPSMEEDKKITLRRIRDYMEGARTMRNWLRHHNPDEITDSHEEAAASELRLQLRQQFRS